MKGIVYGKHWSSITPAPRSAAGEPCRTFVRTYGGPSAKPSPRAVNVPIGAPFPRAGDPIANAAIPDAGIRAGEIIAWRLWKVDAPPTGRMRLISWVVGNEWQPGQPMEGNVANAGVHAFRREEYCIAELSIDKQISAILMSPIKTMRGRIPPTIIGRVALWGEVIEHELGYRAQYAKIVSLDRLFWGEEVLHHPVLDKLRKMYEVV